jgi:hypothetical protein
MNKRRLKAKAVSAQLEADRRRSKACPNLRYFAQAIVNLAVQLFLMIVVIRQGTMDLAERKMGMLSLDFIRIPAVGEMIEYHFLDFGVCVGDVRYAVGSKHADHAASHAGSSRSELLTTNTEQFVVLHQLRGASHLSRSAAAVLILSQWRVTELSLGHGRPHIEHRSM